MPDRMPPEMAEATRLTGLGKLMEATARIQRMLWGGGAKDAGASAATIDAERAVVNSEPQPQGETPEPQPKNPHTFRPHASLRETVTRVVAMAKEFGVDVRPRPAPEPMPEGASFTAATFANAAGTRAYKLYVPANRAEKRPALIVMLHGCTQTPDDFAAGTRMNWLAEEHGFLVAYPQQDGRANVRQCWNWFRPQDQRRGEGEPSLIAGITEEVVRRHGVDPRRVYIAGLSAGGAAAAIMGDVYPDLYAGVCVHSGLPSAAARDLASGFDAMRLGAKVGARSGKLVPTIIFHGERDLIVNPVNADAVAAIALGNTTGLRQETERGQSADGRAYVRATYTDSRGRTVCENWRIREGGHAWSGGCPSGSHTDPRGPDASREMIRFFFQHRRG
jgi:poly(hydroxyalkanoate) depolymerase family esterase